MRRAICAILAVIAMIGGLLLTAAGPSQAGGNSDVCSGLIGFDIPMSCLNRNRSQFYYTKSEIGANPYSNTSLLARYGKTAQGHGLAHIVQSSTLSITHQVPHTLLVPTLRKKIPWPSYKAKSVKKYRKTKYSVYEIYGVAPHGARITWKYGITGQANENTRPKSQYAACRRYFASKHTPYACRHVILVRVIGWFAARTWEAGYTTQYAAQNNGYCPPGMPACV
jgi:hypothetical protein